MIRLLKPCVKKKGPIVFLLNIAIPPYNNKNNIFHIGSSLRHLIYSKPIIYFITTTTGPMKTHVDFYSNATNRLGQKFRHKCQTLMYVLFTLVRIFFLFQQCLSVSVRKLCNQIYSCLHEKLDVYTECTVYSVVVQSYYKNRTSASQARPPRIPYLSWRSRAFLKFWLILARALPFDASLELAASIPKFAPFFMALIFLRFNHKCIDFFLNQYYLQMLNAKFSLTFWLTQNYKYTINFDSLQSVEIRVFCYINKQSFFLSKYRNMLFIEKSWNRGSEYMV